MEQIRLKIKLLKDRLAKEQKINMGEILDVLTSIVNEIDNKADKKTR